MSRWTPPWSICGCSGADKDHPTDIVDITAPVSGVITDQQVTAAAGTQGLASPNAFTISDLSHVWIICDVYENDLPFVRVGESADIRLNAYPNMVPQGSPRQYRTDSRSEYPHRQGSHRSREPRSDASRHVRASDVPRSSKPGARHASRRPPFCTSMTVIGCMCRTAATRSAAWKCGAGQMVSPGQQEILSGIRPGDRVVTNALDLAEHAWSN